MARAVQAGWRRLLSRSCLVATRQSGPGFGGRNRSRRLRFEPLEDRRLLSTIAGSEGASRDWGMSPGATIAVGSFADTGGVASLRQAISRANAGGSAVIQLAAGTYTLEAIGGAVDTNDFGDLDLNLSASGESLPDGRIWIRGAGRDATIIDAQGIDRVFHVYGGQVVFEDLTIEGGLKKATYGQDVYGGGVLIDPGSNVLFRNCTIKSNVADGTAEWAGSPYPQAAYGGGVAILAGAEVRFENS